MIHYSDNFVVCKCTYDNALDVHTFDNVNEMFRWVSKIICFSDCDESTDILQIVYEGKEVHYGGWKQGMHYTFYDKDNNLVYENWFPQWDH